MITFRRLIHLFIAIQKGNYLLDGIGKGVSVFANGEVTDKAAPPNAVCDDPPGNEKCGLYIAESSIPGAGLGLYVGVDIKKEGLVGPPDICICLIDMINVTIAGDYTWSPSDMGTEFEALSVESLCPGLGMAINSHMGLNNVQNDVTEYDSGGLHRSTHPGAGAITYYHDLRSTAMSDIPAGSEVFSSYGEQWFTSRVEALGDIPLEADFEMANYVIKAMKLYMDEYGHKTPPVAQKHVMELVRNILDLDATSKVLQLLPEHFDEVNKAAEVGPGRYNLPESIRSLEWLEANGHCVDNIRAGPSTNPAAGRGAFATRHIGEGATISVSPLLLFHKDSFVIKSYNDPDLYQLTMNYCFSNEKSTMLLFPYGPIVNLINHDSKAPNAKIQWFEKNAGDTEKFLQSELTPDLLESTKVDFRMEYIALRDIKPDEEIFIDYGREWEEAWKKHIEHWMPSSDAKDYVSLSTFMSLHSDDEPVLTEDEQEETPYPDNIVTACFYAYFPYEEYIETFYENDDGTLTVEDVWEGNEDLFTFHQYLRPCGILSRETNSDGDTIYSAEIYNLPDTVSDPASVIPENEHRICEGIPRRAITFVEIPYTGDQHLPSAFRHPIGIPDSIFPPLWKNAQ